MKRKKTLNISKLNNNISTKITNIIKLKQNFKYYAIIPICLMLIAGIFTLCFGFNNSFELSEKNYFEIELNTTYANDDFSEIKGEISNILEDYEITNYRLTILGENINNKILVEFVSERTSGENIVYESIKNDIKSLNSSFEISEDLGLSKTNITDYVVNLTIISFIIIAIVFIYSWIRFELINAIASVFVLLLNKIILISVIVILRLPIVLNFGYIIILSDMLSMIITYLFNDKIRTSLMIDSSKNKNNEMLLTETIISRFPKVLLLVEFIASVSIFLFVISLFAFTSFVYSILLIIIATLVATYTSTIISNGIWCLFYNRKKDKRLKYKIKRLEKKEKAIQDKLQKFEEEKIVT